MDDCIVLEKDLREVGGDKNVLDRVSSVFSKLRWKETRFGSPRAWQSVVYNGASWLPSWAPRQDGPLIFKYDHLKKYFSARLENNGKDLQIATFPNLATVELPDGNVLMLVLEQKQFLTFSPGLQ